MDFTVPAPFSGTPTGAADKEGVAARAPVTHWQRHLQKVAQQVSVLVVGSALLGISALSTGRFVNAAVDAKTFSKAAANAAAAGVAGLTTFFVTVVTVTVGVELDVGDSRESC